jgi:hypothetical protein
MAVDILGHLWAAPGTAANAPDRRQGSRVAAKGQEVTGDSVESVFVAQGYTGAPAAQEAPAHQRQLAVVKLPEAKKGLVLLPKRWVVDRSHL